jgi:hypothetical protein
MTRRVVPGIAESPLIGQVRQTLAAAVGLTAQPNKITRTVHAWRPVHGRTAVSGFFGGQSR